MSARALVVDDIPGNLHLSEAKLATENCVVITVNSGAEVLCSVKSEERDYVVLNKEPDLLRCSERFTERFRLSKLL